MKTTQIYVRLILAAFIVFGSSSFAMSENDLNPTEIRHNEGWKFMGEQHGVSIYFTTVTEGNARFLQVKFENTTASNLKLKWSLSKNSERQVISEDEMEENLLLLDPNSDQVWDGTYLIPVAKEASLNDFVINVSPLN